MKIPIAIEPGNGATAFGVVVPDLPGCFSAGDTLDEACANAVEAIELWLEATLENGGTVPLPPSATLAEHQRDPELAGWLWNFVDVDLSKLDDKGYPINMRFMQQNQRRMRRGRPMAKPTLPMEHKADGLSYRYWLHRDLGTEGKVGLVFVMLKPSTATATKDDPTIRRCSDYALAWGYREYTVVNLYALRTTNSASLWRVGRGKAVGEHNDAAIRWAAANASLIVCAWGNHGQRYGRGAAVLSQLPRRPHCLRMTRNGQPANLLHLPKDLNPAPMYRLGAC